MAFQRPHPSQRRICEEYKAELEEENYHLHSELQTEVDINRQNESGINQLERDYSQYEQKIQTLNREIERLKNASEEEIAELKSEISSLKNKLCQVKKDVCDKEKYIYLRKSVGRIGRAGRKIAMLDQYYLITEKFARMRNSPDLYNSDDNMATIIELANAIDGFMDNSTTARAIMADQVKRATRQIRRKETTLQQDLICKQRRGYDAETEQDNKIIRRQLAKGGWIGSLVTFNSCELMAKTRLIEC